MPENNHRFPNRVLFCGERPRAVRSVDRQGGGGACIGGARGASDCPAMNALLKLRPIRPEDEPALRELRGQLDVERLGLQYWAPEEQAMAERLIKHQYAAHEAHFKRMKRDWDTRDCVIELDGVVVGRFIVRQDAKEVYLADITVNSAHRGKGLGQAVLEAVMGECVQSKRVLRLHVDLNNPALQFYTRLGFRAVEHHALYCLMEWVPATMPGKTLYFPPAQG